MISVIDLDGRERFIAVQGILSVVDLIEGKTAITTVQGRTVYTAETVASINARLATLRAQT